MPVYVHSYLKAAPADAQGIVLERPAALSRGVVVGLAAIGIGLGVATTTVEPMYQLWAGIGCFGFLATAAACLSIARTERAVFDRVLRTLTLASGEVVPFADIQVLVVLIDKDSDGDDGWGLGVETKSGRKTLSRMWCWDEAKVRAAAAAVVQAFPDMPFDPDGRLMR